MILLIELILLVSIWNLGIEVALSDGMILERVRKWAETKGRIFEPLVWCVWCRPSIHSLVGFIAAAGLGWVELLSWNNLILYPFVVAGTSFLSGTVWSVYKFVEVRTKYYVHKEQNEFFTLKDRKLNHFKSKK